MILKIETNKNNPILRKRSEAVDKITDEVLNLVKNMEETLTRANGAGLSACQVGKNIRIFVVDRKQFKKCVFINPEIIKKSKKTEIIEEGCLSLPDFFVPVSRAVSLKVKALDEKGKQFKLKAKGLLARAIQHELDHLSGILICDNDK